jgi:hypothetical protein
MTLPFQFLLAALATWRASALLVREDGPFNVVARVRDAAGRRLAWRVLDCVYCTSLWVAAPAAYWLVGATSEWPVVWFALSGAASLMERVTSRAAAEEPMELEEATTFANRARR